MRLKSITLLALLCCMTMNVLSQDIVKDEKQKKSDELKEKAVVLLRETREEVGTLRTIENRISFNSELAGLLWFYDAKEGRKMFGELTEDFIEILNRYNAEINSYGSVKNESELYTSRLSPTAKSKAIGRMSKAIAVRQQMAMTMATQDAEFAYEFIIQTSKIVTNEIFAKKIEQQDEQMESVLIAYLANQDIDKGLAFARKALKTKFKKSMLTLLKKVYAKDQAKAKSFADEILEKVKSELNNTEGGYNGAYSVLSFGAENFEEAKNKPDAKAIFSEISLRTLSEELTANLISSKDAQGSYIVSGAYDIIKKFSPASAARLKSKYKQFISDENMKDISVMTDGAALNADGGVGVQSAEELRDAKLEEEKTEILSKLKSEGLYELPEKEKQKFIDEAQKVIGQFSDPTEKVAGLSILATNVKRIGNQKLASQLMDEASVLVTQQPRNYIDYLQIWTLAGGYATVDAAKAFPILEQAVFQLNDTIEAFVKVGEFVDVGEDIVIDNEVQLGSFGGSMTQSFVGNLDGSESVLKNMAEADFAKIKAITNGIRRTEVRILIKMLIMQSILDDGTKTISNMEMYDY